MKRCLWFWWDSDGFHQCPSPRKVPHPHSDHPVSRTVHTRMITIPTEPKCLGVWSWTNEDGPAYIRPDGMQVWYRKGLRHRDDGPAVIYPDGSAEWWVDGEFVRREEEKP